MKPCFILSRCQRVNSLPNITLRCHDADNLPWNVMPEDFPGCFCHWLTAVEYCSGRRMQMKRMLRHKVDWADLHPAWQPQEILTSTSWQFTTLHELGTLECIRRRDTASSPSFNASCHRDPSLFPIEVPLRKPSVSYEVDYCWLKCDEGKHRTS